MYGGQGGHWDGCPNYFYPSSSTYYDISNKFCEFDRNKVENVEYDAQTMDLLRQLVKQTVERRKDFENFKATIKIMEAKVSEMSEPCTVRQSIVEDIGHEFCEVEEEFESPSMVQEVELQELLDIERDAYITDILKQVAE